MSDAKILELGYTYSVIRNGHGDNDYFLYPPRPNGLTATLSGYIGIYGHYQTMLKAARQHAAEHTLHLTRAGSGEKADSNQPPAQVS